MANFDIVMMRVHAAVMGHVRYNVRRRLDWRLDRLEGALATIANFVEAKVRA